MTFTICLTLQRTSLPIAPTRSLRKLVARTDNFRRSIYRWIFRTLPDPFMETLDCPDASQLTGARNVSVTPLQAMAVMNNRFVVRQSEHLAARVGSVEAAYRGILQRKPTYAAAELGRAWALAKLGRRDDARRALDHAEELGAPRENVARQRADLK